jgi:hypothetical protein
VVDKICTELIQQTKWTTCACTHSSGEGNFWHRCQNYVHMVEDVLKALRVFDGPKLAMERA